MEEAATERSSRFRPPKSCKEEVSLLERSKPKMLTAKNDYCNLGNTCSSTCILLEIDFQTHVFGYPNTCVWISNHACLDLFFTGYQGASM